MKTITGRFARFIFAIPFIIFGMFHFMNGKEMADMVLAGWPAAQVLVYISGAGLVAAGVAISIQRYAKLAAKLLAVELLLFIILIHIPGLGNEDPMVAKMASSNLLKDLSLMGAALIVSRISQDKAYDDEK